MNEQFIGHNIYEGYTLLLFFDLLIFWTLNVGGVMLKQLDEGNILRMKEQQERASVPIILQEPHQPWALSYTRQKRSRDSKTWLTSSHNHIKLQLRYRTTIIQTVRNQIWKSHNYRIKKETTLRLVGGEETWNRLVPHTHVADKY